MDDSSRDFKKIVSCVCQRILKCERKKVDVHINFVNSDLDKSEITTVQIPIEFIR